MFDFFNDMFCEAKKCFFRYQVDSANQIVVEGYKNIVFVTSEKIVLKVKGCEISINGKCLCVKEFCASTIKISGKILSIENSCFGESYEK